MYLRIAAGVDVVVDAAAERLAAARRQNLVERLAKLHVEYGVDDRIERTVRIAQPSQHFENNRRDACFAEGRHNVDTEEGHPADEKYAHDNP